jgi:hypothetical protein
MSESEPWITLDDMVSAVRDSRTPCTAQLTVGDRRWDLTASWYRSAAGKERVIIAMRDTTDIVRLRESSGAASSSRPSRAGRGRRARGSQSDLRRGLPSMLWKRCCEERRRDGAVQHPARMARPAESPDGESVRVRKTWTLDLRAGTVDSVPGTVVDGCRQIASRTAVTVGEEIAPGLTMLMDRAVFRTHSRT